MEDEKFQTVLRFLKVLADESRLKMLGLLADQEWSVGDLAKVLRLKEPTVSHHLAKMHELGLVGVRAEGTSRFYRLNGETLQKLHKELLAPEKVTSFADDMEGDVWERKVLRNFFEGERLKQIPVNLKQFLVVLKWLTNQFEEGVHYPERQVNEILKRFHPDSATLRRGMIDYGFMERKSGVYWRLPAAARVEV